MSETPGVATVSPWVHCAKCHGYQSSHERWPICAFCGHDNAPAPVPPASGLSDERLAAVIDALTAIVDFIEARREIAPGIFQGRDVRTLRWPIAQLSALLSRSSDGGTTT